MKLASQSGSSLVFATLLLAQAIFGYWQTAMGTAAIDFFGFWSVPHVLEGRPVSNIYSAESQREMATVVRTEADAGGSERMRNAAGALSQLYDNRLDTTGSPLFFAVLGLVSVGNYDSDLQHFALVSLGCLIVAVVLICRLLEFSVLSTMLALIFVATGAAPVYSDVSVGNVNQIQLFIVAVFIFFLARLKRFAAGLTLGFGVMFKPTVAVIAVLIGMLCLADKDLKRYSKTFLGAGVAVVLCIVWSSLYFGSPGVWADFAKSLPRTLSLSYRFEDGNIGLSMLLFHLTGLHASAFLLIGLLGMFAYVAFRTRTRIAISGRGAGLPVSDPEQRALHEAFIVGGWGCTAMLLSSNLVWLHYYVLAIPLVLYTIRHRPMILSEVHHPFRSAALSGVILLLISTLAFYAASWTSQRMLVESLMLNTATVLVALLTLNQMVYREARGSAVRAPDKRTSPATAGARR